jgi:hypothetical protein
MLPKLRMTTYVFILCLFGLTLITVSPVFASSPEFQACKQRQGTKEKKNCFRDLALALESISICNSNPPKSNYPCNDGRNECYEGQLAPNIARGMEQVLFNDDTLRDALVQIEAQEGADGMGVAEVTRLLHDFCTGTPNRNLSTRDRH